MEEVAPVPRKKRVARFKVFGRFDKARSATVSIDRDTDIVSIRPRGRRRTYDITLGGVVEMVLYKITMAEIREKQKDKKKKKLARRGLL